MIAAIVPARGGSKGVPRKNLEEVGGRTLVARAIDAAIQSGSVDVVVCTTDSMEIGYEATAAGAEVVIRPSQLASDTASIEATIEHVLTEMPIEPERFVLHQPSSPLRSPETTRAAVDMAIEQGLGAVYGVVEADHHPLKHLLTLDGAIRPIRHAQDLSSPRQELPRAWRQSGSVYVVETAGFLSARSLFVEPIGVIQVDEIEAIDVDTPADLARCRKLHQASTEP